MRATKCSPFCPGNELPSVAAGAAHYSLIHLFICRVTRWKYTLQLRVHVSDSGAKNLNDNGVKFITHIPAAQQHICLILLLPFPTCQSVFISFPRLWPHRMLLSRTPVTSSLFRLLFLQLWLPDPHHHQQRPAFKGRFEFLNHIACPPKGVPPALSSKKKETGFFFNLLRIELILVSDHTR